MTLVIISGGIDLSVGSIIAFSSVVGALCMERLGVPAVPAVALAVLAGAACGLGNGAVITGARIVPFIVTLGTMMVFRGAAKGLAGSAPVDITDRWIGDFMKSLPPEEWWKLLPPGGWAMILLALAFWAMLRYTRLGRHAVAVGSNEQTARLSGVMLLSRQGQGDPTAAVGYELYVIAAVVIGGGSLSGGAGSVFGTIVGALIMTVIRAGCNFRGLQPWVTEVVTGAILVVAVALDRLRHRGAA
jgi:ribose transport system permease protein